MIYRHVYGLIVGALLTLFGSAKAQFVSENGWFEVSVAEGCPAGGCSGPLVKGCAGLTITMNFTGSAPFDCFSPGANQSCDFDYIGSNDLFTDPISNMITYNEPGSYTLRILMSDINSGASSLDQINIMITDPVPPDFNIFSCSGNQIQVSIDDNQYENYTINYGDGSPVEVRAANTPPVEHTYTGSVQRNVIVRGVDDNAAANCPVATDEVIPITSIPPSAFDSLVSLDPGRLALYYNLQPDIRHRLEISINGSPFTVFNTFLNASTTADTLQNVDTENISYCFRIASIDVCNEFTTSPVYSDIICNVLFDVDFADGLNSLTWTADENPGDFAYERTSSSEVVINPVSGNTFDDRNVFCNQEYCYTLTANYSGGQSKSLERCGTSFTTSPPLPVDNISVSVIDNSVALAWPVNTSEIITSYQILRGPAPGSVDALTSVETNSFNDADLNTQEQFFCYQVDPVDECGNLNTAGVVACSMLLTGTITPDNTVSLSWNDYIGWEDGVSNYIIEKSYATNNAGNSTSLVAQFSEVDDNINEQVIIYRVGAVPTDNSLEVVFSNTLVLIKPNNIYAPNAFTPDGDGLNDTFSVKGRFITDYALRIFNRWGEGVFFSENPEIEWDGTREGDRLPEGTYVFKAEITDQAGREITETGTVLLLRK